MSTYHLCIEYTSEKVSEEMSLDRALVAYGELLCHISDFKETPKRIYIVKRTSSSFLSRFVADPDSPNTFVKSHVILEHKF